MRKRVLGTAFALCALVPVATPSQQTVRFNDRAQLEQEEPPVVSVWIDDGSMFRYGQPVRVRYRVEDDAYVVVARVDWDGNLTLLYPSGRNREALVRGGRDHAITGARLGARGTFVATERNGGTGYVFALASHVPFDLSRLSQRDFSSWVTGISLGRPTARYVGDPYRVITRFAQLVLWAPDTEFDFDIAYYSVDAPTWVTASSAIDACMGSRSGRGWYGYEYDDFGYGWNDGYSRYGCSGMEWWMRQCALGYSYSQWSLGFPIGCIPLLRQPQVANYPNGPRPPRPLPDSSRVNPWVPDSISRPNVEQRGQVNGPHRMTVEPAVAPVAVGRDESYAIPRRAFERMRERGVREGRSAGADGTGPMPMPARPSPVAVDKPADGANRPPREMAPPTRDDERVPPRRANRDAGGESRGGARTYDPPPRKASPSIERERRAPASDRPSRSAGSGRNDPPPRAVDRAPETRNPPAPAPVRTEQPKPSTTERKPAERKPSSERNQ
jgi:hypothetical protein